MPLAGFLISRCLLPLRNNQSTHHAYGSDGFCNADALNRPIGFGHGGLSGPQVGARFITVT